MHRARTLVSPSRVSAHKAAHSAKESAPPDSPTHTTSGYPKSSRLRRTATRTCRKCGDFRGQKGALDTLLVLPQHTRHGVLRSEERRVGKECRSGCWGVRETKSKEWIRRVDRAAAQGGGAYVVGGVVGCGRW